MNVVIMGVQGSGKGTQAKKLSENKEMRHINIGELFRTEMAADSEIGKEAKGYVARGELVPDEVTYGILDKAAPAGSNSLIFDGFPRSIAQAEYLYKNYKLDEIIVLELSEEEAMNRITARRHCVDCKKDYNLLYKPPKVEGICDVCGGRIEARADDKPKEVQRRIEIYNTQANTLLDFFRDKVKIIKIDAAQGINEIFEQLVKEVEALQ